MQSNITIKIIIESKLVYLPLLRQTIRGVCSSVVKDEKIFQDIDLSLNEALSNVIYHAYRNEPDHEIQIVVSLLTDEVIFKIIDKGLKNFHSIDPNPIEDNPTIDSLNETGRGLFLIHQLMDEVTYTAENDCNILLLRKSFK